MQIASESTHASLAGKTWYCKITIVLYSLTVQFSLGEFLRTIISVASPNYHLPQFMSPHRLALSERTAFRGKGERLLERFAKRIEGSNGTLQYYLQQHTSTLFNIPYYNGNRGSFLKSEDLQTAGVLFAELASSCWLQNSHRSMTILDNRSPLTSNLLESP